MITYIEETSQKEKIAETILNQLPEWFGMPESTKEYVDESQKMPFWAYMNDEKTVGFIVLKETGKTTAEIFVMGILPEYHRKGIGRELFHALEQYAKEQGYHFLQVKTVQYGRNKAYDKTNLFYQGIGFEEFECFPTLWDAWNPCQIYVKAI